MSGDFARAKRSSVGLIFLICSRRRYHERIVRQWPLQRLRLIPRRPHPYAAFLLCRQDHRHRLRMDWRDHCIRCRRQEAIDQMRPRDRLRLGATVALELGPDASERRERTIIVQREADDVFLVMRFYQFAYPVIHKIHYIILSLETASGGRRTVFGRSDLLKFGSNRLQICSYEPPLCSRSLALSNSAFSYNLPVKL